MFPVIDVRSIDSARARGERYGSRAKERILHSVQTYARLFADCGLDWTEAGRRAMQYRDAIHATDPELLEEMEGIAHGAKLVFSDILALNCRTEILPSSFLAQVSDKAAQARRHNQALGLLDWGECTAMAVSARASKDGHTWLAQNWDWIGRQRAALVVLHTLDVQGRAIATLTEAGMLAKIGLNDQGMAVGLNILRSVADGSKPGVPVHVLLRHALSFDSLKAFRMRLHELANGPGFGAASNIPAADASGDIGSFEIAPAAWSEHSAHEPVLVHTNHFLCTPLLDQQAVMASSLSTEARLRCAQQYAAQTPISVATIEALLRDESDGLLSVCRKPDPTLPEQARVESVAGIRIDCTERRWWIAPNVPSQVEFEEVATGFAANQYAGLA
ncbi:MAG: peptidase C45 [Betaproteobacteria bacterium]|jgi:isopenicillin-N N-acyltransferase-like protein|nr:peptidase C45 [Betaproteobacteria bacterium]